MNPFPALSGLRFLNKLLAFLLIAGGAYLGGRGAVPLPFVLGQHLPSSGFMGALVGLIVGGAVALLTCGVVLILIEMLAALRGVEDRLRSLHTVVVEVGDALRDPPAARPADGLEGQGEQPNANDRHEADQRK